MSHEELQRLYADNSDLLGEVVYLPYAVLAHHPSGRTEPALCYIAHDIEPSPASPEYVARIVEPARSHGFPDWYIQRLESFSAK
ncbi:MAG: hypothetical protein MPN21_01725 [Thermoanaerobaculia bacterium]|nr:hypothetical protein [Thermoanaerobaculia bacterium]